MWKFWPLGEAVGPTGSGPLGAPTAPEVLGCAGCLPRTLTLLLPSLLQSEPEGFSHFHLYVCAAFLLRWRKEILEERDFQVSKCLSTDSQLGSLWSSLIHPGSHWCLWKGCEPRACGHPGPLLLEIPHTVAAGLAVSQGSLVGVAVSRAPRDASPSGPCVSLRVMAAGCDMLGTVLGLVPGPLQLYDLGHIAQPL